jgi:TRAP-type C4-dicarboxylate transport system permease small subunit
MKRVSEIADRISAFLNSLAIAGAILAVVVMVASAGFQVVARYLFDSPPIWTEEAARYAMVWAGLLGASCAFRADADPTLFPQMRERSGMSGMGLTLVRAIGVVIFSTPVIYFSFFGPNTNLARGFLGRTLGREADMLGVSMIFFTAAIPVAFILILIHVIADILKKSSGLLSQESNRR